MFSSLWKPQDPPQDRSRVNVVNLTSRTIHFCMMGPLQKYIVCKVLEPAARKLPSLVPQYNDGETEVETEEGWVLQIYEHESSTRPTIEVRDLPLPQKNTIFIVDHKLRRCQEVARRPDMYVLGSTIDHRYVDGGTPNNWYYKAGVCKICNENINDKWSSSLTSDDDDDDDD